jgi:aldose 1-epimerase
MAVADGSDPMIEGAEVIASAAMRAGVIPFGASLVGVEVDDGAGGALGILRSLPDAASYEDPSVNASLGATVGRYANRIAGASFTLDGHTFHLDANEGANTLHGGRGGWGHRDWELIDRGDDHLTFGLESPDGDQGFPGTVNATVTYRVRDAALEITAHAETTAPTVISMTNHGYWNLAGEGTVDDHHLTVDSIEYLEVDDALIPTGRRLPTSALLGDGLLRGRRLDHCLVLDGPSATAVVVHTPTGRALTMTTDAPAVQVYTADPLGAPLGPRAGFALEAQRFPDAPNHPTFPSAVLRPDAPFSWFASYEVAVQH